METTPPSANRRRPSDPLGQLQSSPARPGRGRLVGHRATGLASRVAGCSEAEAKAFRRSEYPPQGPPRSAPQDLPPLPWVALQGHGLRRHIFRQDPVPSTGTTPSGATPTRSTPIRSTPIRSTASETPPIGQPRPREQQQNGTTRKGTEIGIHANVRVEVKARRLQATGSSEAVGEPGSRWTLRATARNNGKEQRQGSPENLDPSIQYWKLLYIQSWKPHIHL